MSFNFPQIHAFPPFYTRQIHEETWQKQKDLWMETILGYCAVKRIFEINLTEEETYQWELFNNTEIDRKNQTPMRFISRSLILYDFILIFR